LTSLSPDWLFAFPELIGGRIGLGADEKLALRAEVGGAHVLHISLDPPRLGSGSEEFLLREAMIVRREDPLRAVVASDVESKHRVSQEPVSPGFLTTCVARQVTPSR